MSELKKPFDPVTSLPAEQKKDVLFIRVQIIFGPDDLRQAVDPLSEICIADGTVHFPDVAVSLRQHCTLLSGSCRAACQRC